MGEITSRFKARSVSMTRMDAKKQVSPPKKKNSGKKKSPKPLPLSPKTKRSGREKPGLKEFKINTELRGV